MPEGTQRRLTTIVAADIAGFSRLVEIDEEANHAARRGPPTAFDSHWTNVFSGIGLNNIETQRSAEEMG